MLSSNNKCHLLIAGSLGVSYAVLDSCMDRLAADTRFVGAAVVAIPSTSHSEASTTPQMLS